ncbi:MAG: triose-phosphate isomerase [Flavobacteriales bacterium]|nr:triose-phosphate isomerase [Flavobacteriales bacterium]MCB9447796.1 triose-phosphate isomerase [Flavobacteriales bacterium]
MRLKIVAGNWKMNKDLQEGRELVRELVACINDLQDVQVILAPPYIHLTSVQEMISNKVGLQLAAQNCHHEQKGAFTGEVSAAMLASAGCSHVIIGHSERRTYNHEAGALLAVKVDRALENNLIPIFCCGEHLDERRSGREQDVVKNQIAEGLFHLNPDLATRVVIAYEPVWAIGTGETATPEQAQEMHAYIRRVVADHWGGNVADHMPILYGGSCNAKNARDLFGKKDVDGGLIGGASLNARDFTAIIASF